MLSELVIAGFLVASLFSFFSINLLNLIRSRKSQRKKDRFFAEIQRPKGIFFSLAALGTLFFFLESLGYPFLFLTGNIKLLYGLHPLHFPYDTSIQLVGIAFETVGYFVFLWSVLERGRYATAWEMEENHKLITSGPYRYVRHPSYLGYFLMFVGLIPLLLNPLALIPLIAIPGYVKITTYEEELLIRRFGAEYIKYQKRTGRFLPKI